MRNSRVRGTGEHTVWRVEVQVSEGWGCARRGESQGRREKTVGELRGWVATAGV